MKFINYRWILTIDGKDEKKIKRKENEKNRIARE